MTDLVTIISDERLADAEWLEQAARYFEKRDTGGEDMAFWANVANAERCRSIAQSLRAQGGVRVAGADAKAYIRDWCPDYVKDYIASLEASPAGAGAAAARARIAEVGPVTTLIDNLSDEELAADHSDENPNVGLVEASPAPVSEEMVEQLAISVFDQTSDNYTVPWDRQPGRVRTQIRKQVRQVLTALRIHAPASLAAKGGQ